MISTVKIAVAFATLGAVAAHGHMKQPAGPKGILGFDWQYHWFSQGSLIGCEKSTGTNCDGVIKPCCARPMEPTLRSVNQLTYPKLVWNKAHVWDNDQNAKPLQSSYGKLSSLRGHQHKSTAACENKSSGILLSLDDECMTMAEHKIARGDFSASPFRANPWMAPGHAPVQNPCGVLGGGRYDSALDYAAGPGDSYQLWMDRKGDSTNGAAPPAQMFPPAGTHGDTVLTADQLTRIQDAQGASFASNENDHWKAGEEVEVSYTLNANHGGGVQYRVCPLSRLLDDSMDEACFQQNPLPFAGNTSWFKVGSGANATRTAFTPVRISDDNTHKGGVKPSGSIWTQVGLPACAGAGGGAIAFEPFADPDLVPTCAEPQFQNELSESGFWGYGYDEASSSPAFKKVQNKEWTIVDKVKVPEDLHGDFVVSWRYDSEQTAQVWTQCAVVTID